MTFTRIGCALSGGGLRGAYQAGVTGARSASGSGQEPPRAEVSDPRCSLPVPDQRPARRQAGVVPGGAPPEAHDALRP